MIVPVRRSACAGRCPLHSARRPALRLLWRSPCRSPIHGRVLPAHLAQQWPRAVAQGHGDKIVPPLAIVPVTAAATHVVHRVAHGTARLIVDMPPWRRVLTERLHAMRVACGFGGKQVPKLVIRPPVRAAPSWRSFPSPCCLLSAEFYQAPGGAGRGVEDVARSTIPFPMKRSAMTSHRM